ncbi:CZB domain-containing protein [Candidatus Venteria ishoeyi]|uniref:Chemoreceptor zinc-binding domain-containing protein n=1 Tax=Candidatus Venteria ishoeyi TaxID=1899563 RepID=A0A1H6FAA6_9GAMM|nr:CZB domain-containing protein [Candidatus Venteria ishoeyi]MDM8545043.1 CZB domain-containing protein [Candidatus Venteria ishoeyi]SEH07032.1 Uncharacterised protein [Candidatus Venteria ishoeyi]
MAGKAFFLQRLNDHVQYLKKINATLEGKSDFQGTAHTDCKLGQWIYGEGADEVASLSDPKAQETFDALKEPHEKFHDISKDALAKKIAGDEEGARRAETDMHVLSTNIYNKLLDLDGMS